MTSEVWTVIIWRDDAQKTWRGPIPGRIKTDKISFQISFALGIQSD